MRKKLEKKDYQQKASKSFSQPDRFKTTYPEYYDMRLLMECVYCKFLASSRSDRQLKRPVCMRIVMIGGLQATRVLLMIPGDSFGGGSFGGGGGTQVGRKLN